MISVRIGGIQEQVLFTRGLLNPMSYKCPDLRVPGWDILFLGGAPPAECHVASFTDEFSPADPDEKQLKRIDRTIGNTLTIYLNTTANDISTNLERLAALDLSSPEASAIRAKFEKVESMEFELPPPQPADYYGYLSATESIEDLLKARHGAFGVSYRVVSDWGTPDATVRETGTLLIKNSTRKDDIIAMVQNSWSGDQRLNEKYAGYPWDLIMYSYPVPTNVMAEDLGLSEGSALVLNVRFGDPSPASKKRLKLQTSPPAHNPFASPFTDVC